MPSFLPKRTCDITYAATNRWSETGHMDACFLVLIPSDMVNIWACKYLFLAHNLDYIFNGVTNNLFN